MPAESREEILKKYVGDMLAVVRHTTEACERQLEEKSLAAQPEAHQLIGRIAGTLRSHCTRLESYSQRLGAPSSAVKDAVVSVTGAVIGLYDKVRSDAVSKMLRDDYVALTMAAMAYEMLHTTGLALKDQEAADLALAQMRDLPPLIFEIGGLTPMTVVRELAEQGIVADHTVAEEAARHSEEVWRTRRVA